MHSFFGGEPPNTGQKKLRRMLLWFTGSIIFSFFTVWLTMRSFQYGARPVWQVLLVDFLFHLALFLLGVWAVGKPVKYTKRYFFLYAQNRSAAYLIVPCVILFCLVLLLTRSWELLPLFYALFGFALVSLAYRKMNKTADSDPDIKAYLNSKTHTQK